jgi:O-antigen ligase
LIALLLAAPLAFGAVTPWAWGSLTIVAAVSVVLWAVGCVCDSVVTIVCSPLYLGAMALLALAFVQLRAGLTLNPIGTREAIIKGIAYILIFFLAQQLFANALPRVWQRSALVVSAYTFGIAVFAITQFFASPGLLYGLIKPRWGGYIFGPYVSHNNYAGLMEMLIPIVIACALTLRPGHPARACVVFAIVISVMSVFLSGSRAGVISLLAELVVFAVMIFRVQSRKQNVTRLLIAGSVVILVAGACFRWLDPGEVWKRWQATTNAPELAYGDRLNMTRDSIRMSRDHLAFGVGLGAFEISYTKYQTVATDLVIDYAHNDYAQLLAETGAVGWILLPISITVFVLTAFRHLRSRLQQTTGWLQLGAALGVCGILVHSFVDFNLHIPANAAWFVFCAALATLPTTSGREPNVVSAKKNVTLSLSL